MTCFLWQVTHHITIHTISLSLEERCLKINANDVSNFCCLSFGNSSESRVLWKQENPCVEILSVCLRNLSIPIWCLPWGSYLVCPPWWWAPIFRSHHLSAWLPSGRRDHEPRCQTRICTLGILLQQIVCSVLVLLELRLYIFARDLILALILFLFRRSSYIVPTRLKFDRQLLLGLQHPILPKSSIISLRYNGRCTHGLSGQIAYVLLISIFAVVTKQNVLAAAAYMCFSGVMNVEIWIAYCSSRVLILCTILVAVLTVYITRNCTGNWSLRNWLLVFDGEVALGTVGWECEEVPGSFGGLFIVFI